jgi:3-oxoacyl-[acyl-carrier-protein] synthase-3
MGEESLVEKFGAKDAKRLVKGTGVRERRISQTLCTSDLCVAAAEVLLRDLAWDPASVSHLVLVTQTPDYFYPASACIIQDRLHLSRKCSAFDVNLGCSGYPYGLWMLAKLLEPGQRALLLAGDTTANVSQDDRATMPIFGDAGSATALECHSTGEIEPMSFSVGTDGSGHRHIMVEAGRCRVPLSLETAQPITDELGNRTSRADLRMNGAEVFAFGLREVPPLVNHMLEAAGWQRDNCDDFIFHQANRFMLEHVAQNLELPPEKVPLCLEQYGNTSSASIPLTLCAARAEMLREQSRRYLLAGFGVGWSWAAAAMRLGPIVVPEILEVDELEPTLPET